jgi:hypothetical protein
MDSWIFKSSLFHHCGLVVCWKVSLKFDFSLYFLGPAVRVMTHIEHQRSLAPSYLICSDRQVLLPIPINSSANSPHFLGQNHQNLNIFRWLLCGTEHPISLTFSVKKKWWKTIFPIKMHALLRMGATTAAFTETSWLRNKSLANNGYQPVVVTQLTLSSWLDNSF